MFPTSLEHPFQQSRGRRRGRNEPNNRDYICPCGKSYLSYPALFTHIKIKHNGRAPGQVIKPRSEYANRRGRPKQVYDSDSDTDDIAANCIDRLCDFVTDLQRYSDDAVFKQIYMDSAFYDIYVNFNPQEQQPKYDEAEEVYEETCANVFCEFLAEINKRLNQPYYFDILFTFFMMLARAINEEVPQDDRPDSSEIVEQSQSQQQNSDSQARRPQRRLRVSKQPIRELVNIVNNFMLVNVPKYRREYKLQSVQLFSDKNLSRLIELFFNWLTNKKYLSHRVRVNEGYSFDS